ncbi:hypothetical protein [Nonomuraea angiospora]|uniref:hypothetical protein n=1 Tax=Nonomuraea angiospora TaxID=46172 RepID=UPI0029B6EE6F|nr:hypothetical protein [Nonomuraea angiospora]MDX3102910.1 hypothetical protein [Nonomuraea angiospora]
MATLTAGITWLAATPSTAGSCNGGEPALLSPKSVATYCEERAQVRLEDAGSRGGKLVTTESNKLAMAAGEMARRLGLTGLATGREALGIADLGGLAANWGMPALFSASPAPYPVVPRTGSMKDLATMAAVPALPALPELPPTPLVAKLPAEMSLGNAAPYQNRIAGSPVESPLDLKEPVAEVGSQVVDILLPKAVQSVEGTSMLPGGQPAVDGFTGLARELGLR